MNEIPMLSTGDESNLKNWRILSAAVFGESSPATAFVDKKIAESPRGEEEIVLADERQFLYVLGQLAFGKEQTNA